MDLIEKFNQIIKFTLKWEGGYVDNPNDHGGKTNYGITQRTYTQWLNDHEKQNLDVKDIPLSTVYEIYYKYYFLKIPEIEVLILSLAQVLFDTCVNFGVSGMIMFLEEAFDKNLTGNYTEELKGLLLNHNNTNLAYKIVENRKRYRKQRCIQYPTQKVFLQGWLNRDEDLFKKVQELSSTTLPHTSISIPTAPEKLPVGTYPLKQNEAKYMFIDFTCNPAKYYPLSGEKEKNIIIIDLNRQVGTWVNENPVLDKKENLPEEKPEKPQDNFLNTSRLVEVANSWVGKNFNPGQTEQCCFFVRHCLEEAKTGLHKKVTVKASDGLETSIGYASSLAGDDIGLLIKNREDLKSGDLVFFKNTYGDWPDGTITHIGIYTGNNNFVHRPTSAKPVLKEDIFSYGCWREGRRLYK